MPRPRRRHPILKWTGTLGCVLLAILFVGGEWHHPTCQFPVGARRICISLFRGVLIAGADDLPLASATWGEVESSPFPPPQAWLTWTPRLNLGPVTYFARSGAWSVRVRLWVPLAVLLPPTLWLWHRDRRRPRPGHCHRCDYDLTGNVSGICPECGTPVPRTVDATEAKTPAPIPDRE